MIELKDLKNRVLKDNIVRSFDYFLKVNEDRPEEFEVRTTFYRMQNEVDWEMYAYLKVGEEIHCYRFEIGVPNKKCSLTFITMIGLKLFKNVLQNEINAKQCIMQSIDLNTFAFPSIDDMV